MLALKLKNMDKATEAMKDCSLSEKEPQKLKLVFLIMLIVESRFLIYFYKFMGIVWKNYQ